VIEKSWKKMSNISLMGRYKTASGKKNNREEFLHDKKSFGNGLFEVIDTYQRTEWQ